MVRVLRVEKSRSRIKNTEGAFKVLHTFRGMSPPGTSSSSESEDEKSGSRTGPGAVPGRDSITYSTSDVAAGLGGTVLLVGPGILEVSSRESFLRLEVLGKADN